MKSITYFLTLLVIKLKGIKREFSKNPIDYKKLRKEDVHHPSNKTFYPHTLKQFNIAESLITEIRPSTFNSHLILFCHGGAYVYGPAKHHWDTAKKLVTETLATLWMIDYPKAPENKIDTISENIDQVYAKALEQYRAENIILIGDSVGAAMLSSLTQRLVQRKKDVPSQLILISPVMDASLSNPEIDKIDKQDPMLSKTGVLSAKKMCSGEFDLSDSRISPLNGDFVGFPLTTIFMAENDITYPDQKIAAERMTAANVDVDIVFGEGMPHIWPLLPVMKEAKIALGQIILKIRATARTI